MDEEQNKDDYNAVKIAESQSAVLDVNSLPLLEETDVHDNKIDAQLAAWYPHKGDQLFAETDEALRVDCVGYSGAGNPRSPIGRDSLYCDAFRFAADRLVDGCSGLPAEDALIYPIIASYRHHLELHFKEVIYSCPTRLSLLTDEEIKTKQGELVRTHSLTKLWEILRTIYPDCNDWAEEEAPDAPEAFTAMVVEFESQDPNGQAGRYSEFTNGSQTLPTLQGVDVQILKTSVHKMSNYLRTILENLYLREGWRQESESW